MNATSPPPIALLAYPFRPFFLLVGLYGAVAILAWMGFFFGGLSLPVGMMPAQWHAHEMLFGLVPAAIAGFVLTAMCNWTGAAPLQGTRLLALVLLWIAGRVAFWTAAYLPSWLPLVLDGAFLPILALYVGQVLLRHGNKRNLVLVVLLGLLTAANLAFHMARLQGMPALAITTEVIALDLIAVVMVVIAGRITPAFTANWLRMQGQDASRVTQSTTWDQIALVATLALIPADLVIGVPVLGGVVALIAAAVNGYRLVLWAGWLTRREPLLWILHIGYAWVVLALLLKGLSPLIDAVPASAWYHAMGTGAIATLILGVVTRVSLGHTGRSMKLPRFAVVIYWAILLAGVARVLAALGWLDYRMGLSLAALGWTLAFALFTILYAPILYRPRADGRPG